MGNLLHSCVEMRAAIELSFGVVSGVTPDIHVLDRGRRVSRGKGGFWGSLPHWPSGFNGIYFVTEMYSTCV